MDLGNPRFIFEKKIGFEEYIIEFMIYYFVKSMQGDMMMS